MWILCLFVAPLLCDPLCWLPRILLLLFLSYYYLLSVFSIYIHISVVFLCCSVFWLYQWRVFLWFDSFFKTLWFPRTLLYYLFSHPCSCRRLSLWFLFFPLYLDSGFWYFQWLHWSIICTFQYYLNLLLFTIFLYYLFSHPCSCRRLSLFFFHFILIVGFDVFCGFIDP